jgi:hypothetical protein
MKRIAIGLILIFSLLIPTISPVNAESGYVKVTGKLINYLGEPLKSSTYVSVSTGATRKAVNINNDGTFEIAYPLESTKVTLTLTVFQEQYSNMCDGKQLNCGPSTNDVIFSIWQTQLNNKDQEINFQLPKPIKVNISLVDEQNNNLQNSWIVTGQSPINTYVDKAGATWSGLGQNCNSGSCKISSTSGNYTLWVYPTDSYGSILIKINDLNEFSSPKFKILMDNSFKFCVPMSFEKSNQYGCYSSFSDLDLFPTPTPSKSNSVSLPEIKKITCKKGKLTKKVSGTSPKCPKGYKKA